MPTPFCGNMITMRTWERPTVIPVFASIDLLYDKDKTRSLTLRSEVMCQGTVNYNTTTTTVKVRRSYQSNVDNVVNFINLYAIILHSSLIIWYQILSIESLLKATKSVVKNILNVFEIVMPSNLLFSGQSWGWRQECCV